MLTLQSRHFGGKTGNHLSGYQVVIEWLSIKTGNHLSGYQVVIEWLSSGD